MRARPVRSEASIQRSVVTRFRARGGLAIKLSTLGRFGTSGWPDYMFILSGRTAFVEFKRPGGKVTPRQQVQIDELRAHGLPVEVFDEVGTANLWLDGVLP